MLRFRYILFLRPCALGLFQSLPGLIQGHGSPPDDFGIVPSPLIGVTCPL